MKSIQHRGRHPKEVFSGNGMALNVKEKLGCSPSSEAGRDTKSFYVESKPFIEKPQ